MKDAIVIGGGFAGLAAAVALVERDVRVTLLEERAHLGGRAYSFRDDATGETVDNGQHAMMGCYHHTLAFLERIGASDKVTRQANLRVEMLHPERGAGGIRCPSLPSPLHVGAGLLRYSILSPGERAAALAAGLRLLRMRRQRDARLQDLTVADVLRHHLGQSAHACDSFWYPVAIATLNEAPERAAAGPFAEVLARAFFGSRADSQFVLPAVGLSEMYTVDARRVIEARGGQVLLRARAVGFDLDGESAEVRLADGRALRADACVATLPPRVLDRLLPEDQQRRLGLPALDAFETSPIVSAHLWFDRPILDAEFLGLIGTRTQWVFNRSKLAPGASAGGRQFLSAVISAAHDVVEWDTARVAQQVVADLQALVPAARAARLLRSVIVKEKNATVSPTPAAERLRPGVRTRLPSFFLAGDWIATGLPPTIESAVVSGEKAAEAVLASARIEPQRHGDAEDGSMSPRLRVSVANEIRPS